jgi:transposase
LEPPKPRAKQLIHLLIRLAASNREEAPMNLRYHVELTETECSDLHRMLAGGKHPARRLKRAQILIAADAGLGDAAIEAGVGVGGSTVYRTKRRFVEDGLEAALCEAPRPGTERKLSGKEEALLIATACSNPPAGRARWTLELLAGAIVSLTEHDSLSRETVRRRLAENDLKPWQRKMWCIPKLDADYVARMEDVLDLYAEPPDPKRPVVCFDESPTQIIAEARQPIPPEPGRPQRFDYEYRRNGTANLFVALDAHRPWRNVKVTERRTADDFAIAMRDLADLHFPDAEKIRVVLDNLSTHTAAAFYAAFPAPEARRLLRRIEFHYTPKHASWLNMVEIEIGVLKRQCLDRRIDNHQRLVAELATWQKQRNNSGARINWMFSTQAARSKMANAYPTPTFKES